MREGKWAESELDRLRELYHSMSAREIAERLDRPVAGVYFQLAKLGIRKQGQQPEPAARFITLRYSRCPGCGALARFVAPNECLSCYQTRMSEGG